MLNLIPYLRTRPIRLLGWKPIQFNKKYLSTLEQPPSSTPDIPITKPKRRCASPPKPPTTFQKGRGFCFSEEFIKKLSVKSDKPAWFEPVAGDVLIREPKSKLKILFREGNLSGEKRPDLNSDLMSLVFRLVGIFSDINGESQKWAEAENAAAYASLKQETELLVDELMAHPESNYFLLKWIIDHEVLSASAFPQDHDRAFFVKTLVQSSLKHSVFSEWNCFGSAFQNFVIQVWNDVPVAEATAFCDGILSQVDKSLKEEAYNAILECFNVRVLPHYCRRIGNRLLDEMIQQGFSPTNLAYENLFSFNLAITRLFPMGPEKIQELKTIHALNKDRISNFSSPSIHLFLAVYLKWANDGIGESITFLEMMAHLINTREFPSRKYCSDALQIAGRLLDHFHPKWRNRDQAELSIVEQIQLIAGNAIHINGFKTNDMLSILLACKHMLAYTYPEETFRFVPTVVHALTESGAVLGTPHFEVVLSFYCEAKIDFDFETILQTLEKFFAIPSEKLLYDALNFSVIRVEPEVVLSLYNSIVNQQNPMFEPVLKFTNTPEILSLMIIVSGKLGDFGSVLDFWVLCSKSGLSLSPTCYLNALEGFQSYLEIGPRSDSEYAEIEEYLMSIERTLERIPPACLSDVYYKVVQSHALFCTVYSGIKFQDFQETLAKYVFGYKWGYDDLLYKDIYDALKSLLRRDPSLNSIILAETKKVITHMLSYRRRPSPGTHRSLLSLVQKFGDDYLSSLVWEKREVFMYDRETQARAIKPIKRNNKSAVARKSVDNGSASERSHESSSPAQNSP